jgi:23S rRNA pseudouridine1911/1915/1917 synthase
MEILQIIIPSRFKGQRLDFILAEMLPTLSRSKITSWIKSGDVLISGKPFKPKDKADGKELVSMRIKHNQNNNWIAENIPINIVFEDEDIVVINKNCGMVTHPGAGNWYGTLANALLNYNSNQFNLDRAGIVHRLDKNTSGLMVVAKNQKSQHSLVEQLQAHEVKREYSVIVYGHMISGGTIDEPIGRDSKERIKQTVSKKGKEAITHYRVIKRFKHHTHVKAILETGRTHQIRVHLSHIGHPLIGDYIYGGKVRFPKKANDILKTQLAHFQRQALHSRELRLMHPRTGELMAWKVSLPEDMAKLIDVLSEFD